MRRIKSLKRGWSRNAVTDHLIGEPPHARLRLDREGKRLPFHQWPLEVRMSVKEVRIDGTIKLLDALKAREIIAVNGGRLKRTAGANLFDHEGYLADIARLLGGR